MAWPTAVAELRSLLNDEGNDRLRYRKRCLGRTNGTNTKFQTLEFMRVTDLSSAAAPLGVFVNDVAVSVTADNKVVGEFTLAAPPTINTEVSATYYYQWFEDSELTNFLNEASEWLGFSNDFNGIEPGLQPSALQFAASLAFKKLSLRWSEMWGRVYKLEDAPKDPQTVVQGYVTSAKDFNAAALQYRNDFYTRQGQALSPRFLFASGRVRDPVPKQ